MQGENELILLNGIGRIDRTIKAALADTSMGAHTFGLIAIERICKETLLQLLPPPRNNEQESKRTQSPTPNWNARDIAGEPRRKRRRS